MKRLTDRLKSTDGASFVLALFTFLVVSMVSLVIINAAVTNASGVRERREAEQAYLTVQSVAELIENEIIATPDAEGGKTTRYIKITKRERGGAAPSYELEPGEGLEGSENEFIVEILRTLVGSSVNGSVGNVNINVTAMSGAAGGAVSDYIQSINDGNITATLTSGQDAGDPYAIRMRIHMSDPDYTMLLRINSSGDQNIWTRTIGEDEDAISVTVSYVYWNSVTVIN